MRELRPYLALYRKHWFGLTLGMILALLTTAASIGLLTLSGWFLSAAAVAGLTIARETFNYMLPGAFVRGFAMGRTAGRWGERVVSHDATFKLLTDLRLFFFEKLAPLFPGKASDFRDADVLNRLVSDVDAMDHVYLRLISPMVVGVCGIALLTAFLCWFDVTVGLTLGAILMVLLIVWPILFYKLGKRNGESLTNEKANLRITTLDWLQGYSELTLFGAESRYRQAIESAQWRFLANQRYNAHLTGLAQALMLLCNGWALVLILWISADGIGGNAPDPLIAMMAFATLASFELLMPIAGAFLYLGQTLTSARRLNDVILAPPSIEFNEDHHSLSPELDITLEHVSFSYDNQSNALETVSCAIKQGQKIAIVGKTGSGKSTLLQMLTRSFDPQSGTVSIAGRILAQWNEVQLRDAMTVVSQRVDILNGTLRDNLLMANPDANDTALCHALAQVGLEKLLEDQGLDAWLGDGGRQLSGGEKRRISIARAVLRKSSPIVLLDEPTEGLDKQTEQQIMALMTKQFADKTVVFVTHRLSHLDQMDSILLMEEGQIVEQGTHAELLSTRGRYFQLNQSLT
ncbi:cysteine/glutathione ABC transporter ATP-binding protein/permease CydC [Vibrio astriarenae]|uniref:Glutathione/L-cysteine transport system ATP-binding/permease protein CydC n=1 Tax=Vibrio astriarenae TaxID=1481923 RepID=A0A7Z2T273_9VIBR|nr:cysteine/glutathione ABC transporter ATP-binding protein/permease CydC [Vibrio astriarenae]QIA62998.1 cysteine/glutathione ABC transporter ATP-binding protein/permease CydC [Vibrio astriarenae]